MVRLTRIIVGVLGALGVVGIIVLLPRTPSTPPSSNPGTEPAQTATVILADTSAPAPIPLAEEGEKAEPPPKPNALHTLSTIETPPLSPNTPLGESGGTAFRIQDPYPYPPESFLAVNDRTRAALVNILCTSKNGGLRPTSGSGVVIDPRGVILTNAHVAQYVLLAKSGRVQLSCVLRAGTPARSVGGVEVLYVPTVWVVEHAADIVKTNPTGTGEHDYALLRATSVWSASSLPFDTREAIGFQGDSVLAAGYPSEFIGPLGTLNELHPVSSITAIQELLTFSENTADLIAVSGVIEAQSGSSGGPITNAWGHLIGIITTTSEGATTAERELRALTLSYIDRDLQQQSGSNLEEMLAGNVDLQATYFNQQQAPGLVQLLIDQITKNRAR